MRAMVLRRPGPIESEPLVLEQVPDPEPGPDEVVVAVSVCGICRTDLHVVEGELPERVPAIIPGHQAVGRVSARGRDARRFREGDRVGVAWLHRSCGSCEDCAGERENLCRRPEFTGWTVPGGYAEQIRVPEAFAYALPALFEDAEAAPLLCAGIIGYRALRRCAVRPGERLGLYGFGSSAHIALQVARQRDCEVYVCTRSEAARQLALELGAVWAGSADAAPPVPLDGAILFAPAGSLVPPALRALRPGGTLACAGIYMSDLPSFGYSEHLFGEKVLTSVTANTRRDGRELLEIAAQIPIRARTTSFPLASANEALLRLKQDGIAGSGVLAVS